jgi:hypothetical protein
MASLTAAACGGTETGGEPVDAAGSDSAVADAPGVDTAGFDAPGDTTIADGGGIDGSDVSTSDGPTLDDAAPPGSCNALLNDGTTVTVMQVASDMPAPVGGTVVSGTYHRTSWIRYTGVGGPSGAGTETDRTTAYFSGGNFQIVQSIGGGSNLYFNGTYATSGTTFTLQRVCPTPFTSPYVAYDATPTQIVLYDPVSKQSLTYTRK